MSTDSDPVPLDGKTQFSDAERLALRRLLRDEARMTWARKNLKGLFVAAAGAFAAGWALVEWVRDHVVFK